MPAVVPTPDELRAMPAAERKRWLSRLPAREVVREVFVPRDVVRVVPKTVGVIVAGPKSGKRRYTDADVVRCPLCGAWTLGVCNTGHDVPRGLVSA